jgi:creatinine amidohydrolase
VSEDTGIGNPRASSAGKGADYFAAVTEKIGEFLAGLAGTDPDRMYE